MTATLGDFFKPIAKCPRKPKLKRSSRKAGGHSTVSIYFATQSGTAKRCAQELAIDVAKRGYISSVADLKCFCPKTFQSHQCIILLVSTYGNGEPPLTGQSFGHWLDDVKLPRDTLHGAHFSVFGFGSRDYVYFNAFARHCDAGMAWYGAHRMCQRGESDASAGNIPSVFQAWKQEQLLPSLESTLGVKCKLPLAAVGESLQLACALGPPQECNPLHNIGDERLCSNLAASAAEVVRVAEQFKESLEWVRSSAVASVVQVTELRQVVDTTSGESTKHVELLVDPVVVKWASADTIEIMPKNSMQEVAWFSARLYRK